ncbi:AI-2E family transporter [Mesorhizobium sp. ZMM04-5]|uniref:AI-2E family transporter n=1 Tax=Mesorhizobium marinum TaxID=3228790 RepID=A0ABV3R1P9_9HYPH
MLLAGIFILTGIYALYFARDFVMPVVLAFLLALMLTPIVRFLKKRGMPEALSATLLVLLSVGAIGSAGYFLSGPVVQLANDAPAIGRRITARLSELRHPFEKFVEASHQVEKVTETAQEPGVQRVVLAQPGIISQAAGNLLSGATTAAITFVLSLFLLASGTLFYEKIVQSFTRLSEKKRALRIVYDVEREISRYLLTVAIINAGLGVVIALGLWALGMPNPAVWGVAAAALNFLPYVGALATVLLVAAMSLISFDTLSYALLAPAFVVMCNIIEGQLVTPLVVGRRLEINAVAIFIAVAFWSWLWGFVGALIAVPLLVIVKVFCDHFDSWSNVGNFLSAHQGQEQAEIDAETEASRAGTTA